MNKGFTLVELLAVLFILSVITLVTVPNIVVTNEKSKENDFREFKNTVENAAEVYVETHLDLPGIVNLKSNGQELCIPIRDLAITDSGSGSAGLLNQNLINPRNGINVMSLNASVKVRKENLELIYEYVDESC